MERTITRAEWHLTPWHDSTPGAKTFFSLFNEHQWTIQPDFDIFNQLHCAFLYDESTWPGSDIDKEVYVLWWIHIYVLFFYLFTFVLIYLILNSFSGINNSSVLDNFNFTVFVTDVICWIWSINEKEGRILKWLGSWGLQQSEIIKYYSLGLFLHLLCFSTEPVWQMSTKLSGLLFLGAPVSNLWYCSNKNSNGTTIGIKRWFTFWGVKM